MPDLAVNGCSIRYEVSGRGAPVVLTPGGRWGGYVQAVLARELAKEFRVVTWNRRNTDDRADIVIEGDASEADLWADDLAALIEALNLAPCYVGEYAGCRTTPLLCLKHPHLVKGLMLAWPSGGAAAAESVPATIYQPYIRAALRLGMKGVVEVEPFKRSIAAHPPNGARLLAMDPLRFVRQMALWESFFTTTADLPIAGCRAGEDEWASIMAPAIVIGGVDPVHPTETAQRLHRLLRNSVYHAPVVTQKEWRGYFGVVPYPQVSDFQGARIATIWRDFIRHREG